MHPQQSSSLLSVQLDMKREARRLGEQLQAEKLTLDDVRDKLANPAGNTLTMVQIGALAMVAACFE